MFPEYRVAAIIETADILTLILSFPGVFKKLLFAASSLEAEVNPCIHSILFLNEKGRDKIISER